MQQYNVGVIARLEKISKATIGDSTEFFIGLSAIDYGSGLSSFDHFVIVIEVVIEESYAFTYISTQAVIL